MDYRDERDALRARLESLESALATARAEVERMRATEAALDAAKRETARLRAEVERLRSPQKASSKQGLLLALALLGVAGALAALFLMRGRSEPSSDALPSVNAQAPLPADPQPEPPRPPRAPEPPQAAPTQRTPEYTRSAQAEWNATITKSEGAAPAAGTACKILANLAGNGESAHATEVEVTCGNKFLYRSTDRFSGMSNRDVDVGEANGKADGAWKNSLVYQDQGTRSGDRSQISLDTVQRAGTIWSENVPTFRVDLKMEPWSLERTGDSLIDPSHRVERLMQAVLRTGTIKDLEGNPGVAKGASCSVDVSPAAIGKANCRVRVRCGGKLFYGDGDSGYNECPVADGKVGRIADKSASSGDGDPAMDLDLSENTLVLSEDGESPWKMTVQLNKAP